MGQLHRFRWLVGLAVVTAASAASAQETLKLAVGQRTLWDTSVSELGQRAGIMKRHGLTLDLLYTSGGAESQVVLKGRYLSDHVWSGDPDSAIEHFSRAMRLSPLDPETYRMQAGMAAAHLFAGRFDTAVINGAGTSTCSARSSAYAASACRAHAPSCSAVTAIPRRAGRKTARPRRSATS